MKPITHHLTEQQIERLQAEARRTGLPVAEIIRRAVDAWLIKNETWLAKAERTKKDNR